MSETTEKKETKTIGSAGTDKKLPRKSPFAALAKVKPGTVVKKGVAVALAGALVAGGLWYINAPDEVATATVAAGPVTATVTGVGNIAAETTVTVYAPVAGKVTEVGFKKNDTVNEGDILAQYDTTTFENDYKSAVANTAYYQDGYKAAVDKNNTYQEKYNNAVAAADTSREQYEETKVSIDEMDTTQFTRDQNNQNTLLNLERRVNNLSNDMELSSDVLSTAQSSLDSAEADVARADTEIYDTTKKLNAAKALLASATTPADVTKYQEQVTSLQATLDTATAMRETVVKQRDEYQRRRNNAQREMDDYEDDIKEERIRIEALSRNSMTPEEYAQYQELERKLDLIERDWSHSFEEKMAAEGNLVNQSQLAQYKDSVQVAAVAQQAALDRLNIAKGGVTADVSGIVLEKFVDSGATVEAGAPLYTIQPDGGYKASLMVSRFDIGSVKVGQKAEVSTGSEVYSGTVSTIAPVAETDASGKPKVKVDIRLDGVKDAPPLGIEADVTIHTAEEKDTLSVATDAVYTDDDGTFVYVLSAGGIAERRDIETGIEGGGMTQVVSGLTAGEQVITSPMTKDRLGEKFEAAE